MKQRNIYSIAIFTLAILLFEILIISGFGFKFSRLFSAEIKTGAQVTTIFVDDNATPGGDGSKSKPFNTIFDGLNAASYGDTVQVLPGTYIENVAMKAGVALLGSGAKVTIIRANTSKSALAIVVGAKDAILQGFTIIHPGTSDQRHAIFCHNCSMRIFDNIIINYGSEYNSGFAIRCYNGGATVARNLIHSFSNALSCADSSDVIFRNNIVFNRNPGFKIGVDVDLVSPSKIIVQNNTFVLIGISYGFRIFDLDWSRNLAIFNNIIYSPDINSLGIVNLSEGPLKESYNDIFVGGDPYSGCNPGSGDIQIDPLFVNLDRSDFRLSEGSPCINAGDPNPIYDDVDGTRNDMGAFGGPDPINLSLTLKMFASIGTSSVSGFPGDTVIVSVELENAAGIAQAHCTIDFDSGLLSPVEVKKTFLTKDFLIKTSHINPDQLKIELSHNKEIQSGRGSIVDMFFLVNENAHSEQASPLRLPSIALWDGSGSSIDIKEVTHGCFYVNIMGASEHIIYVDGNYTGIEDGSPRHPYNTIVEGIAHTSDGDTVFVASGLYQEMVKIDKGLFLKGSGAQATIIEGDSLSELENYVVHLNTDKPCGISGFTIRNKPGTYVGSLIIVTAPKVVISSNRLITDDLIPGFSLVDWSGSNGGIFQGNYVQGCPICLYIKKSANLSVQNNTFTPFNLGMSAITCELSQMNFYNNRIRITGPSSGISATSCSTVSIKNNIIVCEVQNGGGIGIIESHADIINNTIVTSDFGIAPSTNVLNRIMNNIVVGFNRWSSGVGSTESTILSYNNVWNHTNNYVGLPPDISNISVDPMFVDPLSNEFHLQPGSPCKDTGNPDPAYNDLDGSRNDMGAFGGPFADTTGFLGRQVTVALVEPQQQTGDTLYVPVMATSMQGISSMQMQIEYNESQLQLLAVRQGEITQPFSLSESQEAPGITKLRLSSPLVIRQSSGSICELIAQVQTTTDTSTVIRLNNLIFKDQVDNIYAAAPVEGHITITAVTSGNKGPNFIPDQFALLQNYPNPFNPTTTIRYELPQSAQISLKIYNLLGQEIRTLYEGAKSDGNHQMIWNGKNAHGIEMPSGLYFCRLSIEGNQWIQTIKLLLVR